MPSAEEDEIIQLQRAIEDARAKLVAASLALQEKSQSVVRWRVWYKQHPGYCLLGAFAVGMLLGRRARH